MKINTRGKLEHFLDHSTKYDLYLALIRNHCEDFDNSYTEELYEALYAKYPLTLLTMNVTELRRFLMVSLND